jgi:hypothetical protein
MRFSVDTSRYLAVLVDIYVVNEVDGFNGNPKGSEAARWKPKTASCKNRNWHFVILVKIKSHVQKCFHLEPERCEALIANRFQPFLNQRPSDALRDSDVGFMRLVQSIFAGYESSLELGKDARRSCVQALHISPDRLSRAGVSAT